VSEQVVGPTKVFDGVTNEFIDVMTGVRTLPAIPPAPGLAYGSLPDRSVAAGSYVLSVVGQDLVATPY
jgi:hypothetical protein